MRLLVIKSRHVHMRKVRLIKALDFVTIWYPSHVILKQTLDLVLTSIDNLVTSLCIKGQNTDP